MNRTPSPAPGVWPGIIGRDHHIWPGPGMGINPPPAPGIHGAGNPGRFLEFPYEMQKTRFKNIHRLRISASMKITKLFNVIL